MDTIKIDGRDDYLLRDLKSKAIISNNKQALNQAQKQKKVTLELRTELNQIHVDILTLKEALESLINIIKDKL